jgi:tRNA threonylcarbamoyladenosine biosynthesis protein TsaB
MTMHSDPHIVAIETSGRTGSVAIARGPSLLAVRELPATMRHAVELMPAIRELVRAQGWRPAEIDHVYLSLGPGSFTGLRIAVAIARAMAQAAGCRLVGVPSLDVIAENAPPEFAVVVPVLDAKRGQVFAARYERTPDGALQRTIEAGLVDPAAFVTQAAARARELAGPAARVAILGEGVDYHRPALQSAGESVVELDKSLWPGQAATVHRLGYAMAQQGQFADPNTLLPIYIRLPEAEEVYRKKHGQPV